jgi:hypothetical protein
MFEENGQCWDDIAEICMKIDDELPPATMKAVLTTARAGDRAA